MITATRLPLFMAASLALLLAPGPAVLYIIARSIDQGRLAGLVSVLSIEVGNFSHVLMATVGLSALLISSPVLFTLVKYLGAGYLIYLGLNKWFSKSKEKGSLEIEPQSMRRIFSQGVIVAIFNPKTALFFLAFLPQFVEPARGQIAWQMFLLGSIFVGMACLTDSMYALLAGGAGQWLKRNRLFTQGERYLAGGIYFILGLVTVITDIFQLL